MVETDGVHFALWCTAVGNDEKVIGGYKAL